MDCKKASLTLAFILLVNALCVFLVVLPQNVRAKTLYVGGSGPGNYTSIQVAVDAADPGDTVFVYKGTYLENIIVNKTISLVGEDRYRTIIDADGVGSVVHISADWVNVTGFNVTKGGTTGGDGGIELYFVENCSITDNVAYWNRRAGVFLFYSNNNTVNQNNVSKNGPGIYLRSSGGNIVANNNVSNNGAGIVFYYSGNNTIEHNNVAVNGDGVFISDSTDNLISSNNVSHNAGGIVIRDSRSNIIDNNSAWNNWWGVNTEYSNSNTIEYNTISSTNKRGINMAASRKNKVANNSMLDVGMMIGGLLREDYNTHTIDTSNTINGKPVYYWKNVTGGIIPPNAGQVILANCTNVVVENQSVSDGFVGIELGFSRGNTITKSDATDNYLGIYLISSSYNTIDNSTFSNNKNGIRLWSSDDNTIINNTASLNWGRGIRLWTSYNNTVYHNNFVDNTDQPNDDSSNSWDNGYPSGGNYWSRYNGTDQLSGPNQDQPGSDDIGDTPFGIEGGTNMDRYPLMYPTTIVPPRPPDNFQAALGGVGFQNVTLNWSLSLDDGAGFKSVVSYRIYRNSSHNPTGQGYQLIASLPNGSFEYIDVLAGEGDSNNYFYRLCAVDYGNNATCATDQAAKFTRPLAKGPNLVSIPLVQSNETIGTVLQTVSFNEAWLYDSHSHEWKSFIKSKPYDKGLEFADHIAGMWVNVTGNSNLTVAGVVPAQTLVNLHVGWNLVGYPSFDTTFTVADLMMATPMERIEGFAATDPPYYLKVLLDLDVLQAGHGYWVYAMNDMVWTLSGF